MAKSSKPSTRLNKRLVAPRQGPPMTVVEGERLGDDETAPPSPKFRVSHLTADARKQLFARNLNQLLDVLDLNRKTAADEIGISYRWVRRVVTGGVSRPDKRNLASLEKLVSYFCLPNIDALWTPDLVAALIASEPGRSFVEKFGAGISTMVHEQVERSGRIDETLVNAWTSTHGEPEQRSTPSYEARLAALIATGQHDSLGQLDALCKRMVEEAYEKEFGERPDEDAALGLKRTGS